jgi:hypothetical protein
MIANTHRQSSFLDLKIWQSRLSNHESPATGCQPLLSACAKIVKARGFGGALRSRGARENADGAGPHSAINKDWLQWGERPVADRGGVQSHNLHLESHDVAGVAALSRMTGKGRLDAFAIGRRNGRYRRILLVPARSDGRRLTERTAAVQPRRREWVKVPPLPPLRSNSVGG